MPFICLSFVPFKIKYVFPLTYFTFLLHPLAYETLNCTGLLLMATQLFAQKDSSKTQIASPNDKIYSLSRADIERLPATSFLELVQGAFPFVTYADVYQEDFAFMVNGFVTVDPSAISISQIETITFLPQGTQLTRGSMAKKGTFVVTTRKANGITLTANNGALLRNRTTQPTDPVKSANTPFLSLDELTYNRSSNKSYVSSSLSFLNISRSSVTSALSLGFYNVRFALARYRFSNFAGYKFNDHLRLDGGIFFTSQIPSAGADVNYYYPPGPSLASGTQSKWIYNYLSAAAALKFSPSAAINNTFQVEANHSRFDGNDSSWANTAPFYASTHRNTDKFKVYLLSNNFTWQAISSSDLNLQASFLARYKKMTTNNWDQQFYYNSTPTPPTYVISEIRSSSLSFNPQVSAQWKNIIYAEAGATWDNYATSYFGNNSGKLLPNASLKINLAPLLKGGALSGLQIASSYSKYIFDYDRVDDLQPYPALSRTNLYDPAMPDAYAPTKNWFSNITASFLKNRLSINVSYMEQDRRARVLVQVPLGGNFTASAISTGVVYRSSLAFALNAAVIDKANVKWTLAASITKDKYETHYGVGMQPSVYDPIYFDAGKDPWRGEFKTSLTVKRFFMQASMLFGFNEFVVNNSNVVNNVNYDATTYRSNFLLAGYQLKSGGGHLNAVSVNIQAKNIIYSDDYFGQRQYIGTGSPYIGIGLQASIR